MAVVLRDITLQLGEVRVISSGDGHPVADGVTTDDEAAGMDAGAADGAFQHAGVLDGVALARVGRGLGLTQFRRTLDGIVEIHLQAVGQTVGDGLA